MFITAILYCQKCQEKILEKEENCHHCGCPITSSKEVKADLYEYNGVEYDITEVIKLLIKGNVGVAIITFGLLTGVVLLNLKWFRKNGAKYRDF